MEPPTSSGYTSIDRSPDPGTNNDLPSNVNPTSKLFRHDVSSEEVKGFLPDQSRLSEYSTETSITPQSNPPVSPNSERLQQYTPRPPTTLAPPGPSDTPDPARLVSYSPPDPTQAGVDLMESSETRVVPTIHGITTSSADTGVASLPYVPPYRPPRRIPTLGPSGSRLPPRFTTSISSRIPARLQGTPRTQEPSAREGSAITPVTARSDEGNDLSLNSVPTLGPKSFTVYSATEETPQQPYKTSFKTSPRPTPQSTSFYESAGLTTNLFQFSFGIKSTLICQEGKLIIHHQAGHFSLLFLPATLSSPSQTLDLASYVAFGT